MSPFSPRCRSSKRGTAGLPRLVELPIGQASTAQDISISSCINDATIFPSIVVLGETLGVAARSFLFLA